MRYAATTIVPESQSRQEIERTLRRYGAEGFMFGWEGNRAMIAFKSHNRAVRFFLPLPELNEFKISSAGRRRSSVSQLKHHSQAVRQRWRALALSIKAKLEAVEGGIVSFDEEFLPYLVLADGRTVGEVAVPEVLAAYESGKVPKGFLTA